MGRSVRRSSRTGCWSITASTDGEIGNETSRYFNPEVAEAVTLGGQWFIKKTATFAEARGYRVLAGDTDSLYLKMTEAQATAFVKECDGYYREIVRPFNVDPSRFLMELEYENYFESIAFVRKKRYAGVMRVFKGERSDVIEVKGLECMRSDGLEYARAMQRRALELVLRKHRPPVAEVEAFVEAERARVFSGELTVGEVSMTQAIEKSVDEYKTKPPHVRIAERIRAVSAEYFVGMKVPYVMVPAPRDPEKPWKVPPPVPVWAREYAEGTYDRHHAWNAKVWPPTMRVLEVVYPERDWLAYHVDPPRSERPPAAPRKPAKKKTFSVVRKKVSAS